mmetsp:Transcript_17193/g.28824  ORF Transcript_17193/g.28824 Transcript_17193/m.28824 type:complete len:175 (-) Transcript_17193:1291-1815(-)
MLSVTLLIVLLLTWMTISAEAFKAGLNRALITDIGGYCKPQQTLLFAKDLKHTELDDEYDETKRTKPAPSNAKKEEDFDKTLNGLLAEARANNKAAGRGGKRGTDFTDDDLLFAAAELKKLKKSIDDKEKETSILSGLLKNGPEEYSAEWFAQRLALGFASSMVIIKILDLLGV